jgi:hypothetical protein
VRAAVGMPAARDAHISYLIAGFAVCLLRSVLVASKNSSPEAAACCLAWCHQRAVLKRSGRSTRDGLSLVKWFYRCSVKCITRGQMFRRAYECGEGALPAVCLLRSVLVASTDSSPGAARVAFVWWSVINARFLKLRATLAARHGAAGGSRAAEPILSTRFRHLDSSNKDYSHYSVSKGLIQFEP